MTKKKDAIKILFVCIENSCRSQMAEGFARYYGYGLVEANSAGSKPGKDVNPTAIQVMHEKGINISRAIPKSFEELPSNKFDYVITMGCKEVCPYVPAVRTIAWNIIDPKGKPITFFRKVRDTIESQVINLIKEIEMEHVHGTPF